MKQFNKLIEFRQAVYDHGLIRARDAQFELVDALLLSPPIRSFPELSLSPVFQRQWPSAYAAIEDGEQDRAWLERKPLHPADSDEEGSGVLVGWHGLASSLGEDHAGPAICLQPDQDHQQPLGGHWASLLCTGLGA